MTNRLAYSISLFLCHKGSIEEEDIDIYTYGFEIFMDSILETSVILLAGVILKCVPQTILFIASFGVLRSYTGGYHANNKLSCTIMTMLTYLINVIFSHILSAYKICHIVMGFIGVVLIWIYAPKSHVNKVLADWLVVRNRKISRYLCVLYVLGILILGKMNVGMANVLGLTLFQVSILLLPGKEEKVP